MARYPSSTPGFRKSLLDGDTGAAPLVRLAPPLLSDVVGPGGVNQLDDVSRVEALLTRTALLTPKAQAAQGQYDQSVEGALRSFQKQRGLKADGLLNPGGPTERALRAQADQLSGEAPPPHRPQLRGLDGAAVAENARAVTHLVTTGNDGLYPDLLSETAQGSRAGRSQVTDFFAQLMRTDHDRAGQLRAKMGLADDEDRQLFTEVEGILAADAFDDGKRRLSEFASPLGNADDNDDDGDDGIDNGDDGSDTPPPYDPDHPQPGDPDDPDEPDDPGHPKDPKPPEKPKPGIQECERLRAELNAASSNLNRARQAFDKASEEFREASILVKQKWQELLRTLPQAAIGIVTLINDIRKLRIPRDIVLPSEALEAYDAYKLAEGEAEKALDNLHAAESELKERQNIYANIMQKIESIGCSI
mgnify:CR=1 FL=1